MRSGLGWAGLGWAGLARRVVEKTAWDSLAQCCGSNIITVFFSSFSPYRGGRREEEDYDDADDDLRYRIHNSIRYSSVKHARMPCINQI